MCSLENEYHLLYPYDIETFPLIYEDCNRLTCSIDKYKKCELVPDCPAYYPKKEKVENPHPVILDFFTTISKRAVIYADCYMALSLSNSSFVVSPKLFNVLQNINIEGIQFVPAALLENNEEKYTDFWYIHTYNFLPVLSVKNSRYQMSNGRKISNNILEIKFNTKLDKINLKNRLIFRFPLSRSYFIFHSSVVEKLFSVNPVGLRFIKVSEYNLPDTGKILI